MSSIKTNWVALASSSELLGKLHYFFLSSAFDREVRSVLAGHQLHQINRNNFEKSNYALRRNIHRLEKGLIMRPRRAVFASDYIQETVNVFVDALGHTNEEESSWAESVLTEYFDVLEQDADDRVESARKTFHENQDRRATHAEYIRTRKPYQYRSHEESWLISSHEFFFDLATQRRSVRWFEDQPVPRSTIDKAIEIAASAPSACNRQPYKYLVFDDPSLVGEIASLPMGVKGYEHNIPALAVLIGKLRAYPFPRDRHVIYIDASLSAMTFVYSLESLGLGTCIINWPDIPELESKMESKLSLGPDERVVMLIAFGFPDKSAYVPSSVKQPLEVLRSYNPGARI
ncbi:nitroreductase family protein [Salinisphaera dokdonensis]|uniref:nitroreductase family protein n=1 Tax=Salinisphaera dokdonensis TaxID=454598 RepID=UPI00333FE88A